MPPTAGASIPVPSASLPKVSVISEWPASSNWGTFFRQGVEVLSLFLSLKLSTRG